jgi:type I restriction enzyme S subunit
MDYKCLGKYIREVNVRNKDLKVTNLQGVSISKQFIPSIANTIGTDMSTYKVVNPGQFAYGPVTSRNGDKVSIALYKGGDDAIISQAYTVFEVIDSEQISSEYLMMWFQRPEFDRYARFHSHGSAREIFDWDELCGVYLPLPDIDRQREIVEEYETLSRRIRLNEQMIEKLEATAQALYRKMFVDGIDKENLPEGWRMGTLGEYAKVRSGYAFPSEWWQKEGISVIKISNIVNNSIITDECDCVSSANSEFARNYIANTGDIVIAMTGATLGKIAIVPQDGLLVNQRVGLFDLGSNPLGRAPYLYWMLQQDEVQNEIVTVGGDSAQANVSNSNIENIEIAMTEESYIEEFNKQGEVLLNKILLLRKGNSKLTELQSLLLAKMGQ